MSRRDTLRRSGLAMMLAASALIPALIATDSGSRAAAPTAGQAAPAGVRRLTETQYRQIIADTFGPDIRVVGRFEPDLRMSGLLAVGTGAVSVTSGGFEQYEALARNIADQVTSPERRGTLVGCAPDASDVDGRRCAEAVFSRYAPRLLRRPLAAGEREGLANAVVAARHVLGDYDAALATVLAGILSSPDFLFRIDRPGPVEEGQREVDSWSKASRLSFFLWNTAPDPDLIAAAGRGDLDRPETRARIVEAMIASPRFTQGVRVFFTDFLHLDEIDTLSKDARIYPAFSATVAADAREQTLRTILDLLVDRNGDYRDLFVTRRFAMNRTLGPLYDVPVPARGWTFHEFPAGDPRGGILTQISLLAQHSHPGRTSPTLRGKAIQEIFLCETIPSPPANVNFAVVQNVDNPTLRTTRARLQAHLDDEECASCHKLTDPIGLSLETFDGAGRFRRLEHGEPIDTSGTFGKTPFDGAVALGALLRASDKPANCLVEASWRYATGRTLTNEDRPTVTRLQARFASAGYRMTDLMRAIATSAAFYRYGPDRSGVTIALTHGETRQGALR